MRGQGNEKQANIFYQLEQNNGEQEYQNNMRNLMKNQPNTSSQTRKRILQLHRTRNIKSQLSREDSSNITPWNQSLYLTQKSWIHKNTCNKKKLINQEKIKQIQKKIQKPMIRQHAPLLQKQIVKRCFVKPKLLHVESTPTQYWQEKYKKDLEYMIDHQKGNKINKIQFQHQRKILKRIYSQSNCHRERVNEDNHSINLPIRNKNEHLTNYRINFLTPKHKGQGFDEKDIYFLKNHHNFKSKANPLLQAEKRMGFLHTKRPLLEIL